MPLLDCLASYTGITADSRYVTSNMIFVALPGSKQNGNQFIDQALQSGATAIVSEQNAPDSFPSSIHYEQVPNARHWLAQAAASWYPTQVPHQVAVTGTNGKTSTVHFFREIGHKLGYKTASIGTLGVIKGGDTYQGGSSLTTPDTMGLHAALETLAKSGVTHMALEASSHGIDQYRLDGVQLEAAAFTNLTHDHLDYHGTVEAYFHAKQQLFARILPPGKTAIICRDIAQFDALAALTSSRHQRVLSYGPGGDIDLLSLTPTPAGQTVEIRVNKEHHRVDVPLVGAFQAYNVLAALGLWLSLGEPLARLLPTLSTIPSVPGRMERVMTSPNKHIYVDYAHTPDGLEKALAALRAHCPGKLWVVFGCGGDRDPLKRPVMGRLAAELADHVIVTDDNPRTENPPTIRAQVLEGCNKAIATRQAVTVKEIGDRKEAISYATAQLTADDCLLIAGKGHEKMQIIGTTSHAFDDVAIAAACAA